MNKNPSEYLNVFSQKKKIAQFADWKILEKQYFSFEILYKYIYIYIQSWPKISAPLVNMIKEGCENEFAFLIVLIFYLKNAQTSNLLLDDNYLKWGKYHYEINVFLKYTLDTIIDTLRNSYEYLWSIFPFIFTILSTPGWLWTWNYPAMASCFTEI